MTDLAPMGGQAREGVSDLATDTVSIASISEQLRELRAAFDAKIRYDAVRERQVEAMSEELATLRRGVQLMQVRPLLLDLIAMYDDVTRMSGSSELAPGTFEALVFFRDTIEQTLSRNGVEKYVGEGLTIDRATQRVVDVLETADPTADRHLAHRLRAGFFWDGKVLRPEWVSAYRHVASAPTVAPDVAPAGSATPTSHESPAKVSDEGVVH